MRRMMLCLLAALMVATACGGNGDSGSSGRPTVVTAFYPLTYLVERIGGDAFDIRDLTPAGVEPHDLELTADQVAALSDADLVVYVGEHFQPALEDVLADLDVERIDVLEGRPLLEGHVEEEEEEHAEESEGLDPHVWLSPTLYATIATSVAAELSEIDPDNADAFEQHLQDTVTDLEQLDQEFAARLANCERNEMVVSHEAFGYLAAEYGLEQVGVSGVDPEAEPSAARLAEVKDFAEDNGVTTIFFEELLSPAIAETLADELGIATAVLSPLETEPETGDYLVAMRTNLAALEDALGCT